MNTFLIVIVAVPVSMIIALAIALLLNAGIKASKVFQAIYSYRMLHQLLQSESYGAGYSTVTLDILISF